LNLGAAGAASYLWCMFIRKNRNRSGSISIQLINKIGKRNRVIKTVGCARTARDEEQLVLHARAEMDRLQGLQGLFIDHDDLVIDNFVDSIGNDNLQIVGSELILGKIYKQIGYPDESGHNFFRNLVLCRLVYPGSKLKTVEYFKKHLNIDISVYAIYRFMDTLQSGLKRQIEETTYEYTKKVLRGRINVVFYDMTTLYFEASEEDDFRIPGYSKDGKHQQPQIIIGLLVGSHGYPIGYELFEGNTSETKTLIPVLESFQKRFNIGKPIITADAALLSQKNIDALVSGGYQFILGGRLKNESDEIKNKILSKDIQEGHPVELKHSNGRLIVTFSAKRAHNDNKNRIKGLKRLEKKAESGKLKKEHINNRGYNKYLKLTGDVVISIDYEKFNADNVWDGLKGYLTNTALTKEKVIANYQQLWQIEKAFRISKTDLRIRPVYHRIKHRIESHLCICFSAYAVYKELERLLQKNNIELSPEKAINEIKEIRQLQYRLPISGQVKTKLLQLNNRQRRLMDMHF
jgi:transposase